MANRPFSAAVCRPGACNGTDTDVITLTQDSGRVRVTGRDLTGQMEAWVTVDQAVPPLAATPVAGTAEVQWIGPRDTVVIETPATGPTTIRITSAAAYPYIVSVA